MVVIEIIFNLSLLVALVVLSGFMYFRIKRNGFVNKIVQGLLFGFVAVLGMMNPFVMAEGLIFDGRSVVLSLCAYFFGPISAAIAVIISIIYRVDLGGPGALMGVSVIISSALLGWVFSLLSKRKIASETILLLSLGIVVHFVMIVLMLALPGSFRSDAFNMLAITIILTYPLATLLMGKILTDHKDKLILIEELKRSEEKFKGLLDNAFDAIYILEGKQLKYVNKGFTELSGYGQEELLKPDFDFISLVSDESVDLIEERFTSRFQGRLINPRYQMKLRTKNGDVKDVDVSTVSFDASNHFTAFGILRDITANEKYLEKLEDMNRLLEQSNADKDKLFALISHDLRGPFSAFLGLTQLLSDQLNSLSETEIREIARQMLRSAGSYYDFLENLLEWSRLKRGKIEFEKHPLDLHSLLHNVIESLKDIAENKEISFVISVQKCTIVYGDITMLSTVFRNLIQNAVKFSHRGSEIKIQVHSEESDVQVVVEDKGIGMSPQVVDNLFSSSATSGRKGTEGESSGGLGLLLCKEFLDLHHANIFAESTEGQGSRFIVSLPAVHGVEPTNTPAG